MKILGIAMLLLLNIPFTTFGNEKNLADNLVGTYVQKHDVVNFSYKNKDGCEADGGKFEEGENLCLFRHTEDNFEIKKIEVNTYSLSISKIGTNFHLCEFEATATKVNENTLISKSRDSSCVVQVNLTGSNAISVITNGNCQEACGAGMSLDTVKAIKINN
jgi:hypothetical protein